MNTAVIHDGVAYFDGTERVRVSPCPHCDKPFQRVKAHITKNAVCRQKAQEAEAADVMRLIAERNAAMRAGDDEAFEHTQTALNEATESETPVLEPAPEPEEKKTLKRWEWVDCDTCGYTHPPCPDSDCPTGEELKTYTKWNARADPKPEPEEDEEEGVKETCPHCGDEEVLTDRSFNPAWTERFPARVCWGCYSGEKDRECEECGCVFTPCVDDTFVVCGDCYELQQGGRGGPLADRIWSWLLSHAGKYNGKTARQIAKALGEDKHAVNKALYADPVGFTQMAVAGQKAPAWRCSCVQ